MQPVLKITKTKLNNKCAHRRVSAYENVGISLVGAFSFCGRVNESSGII